MARLCWTIPVAFVLGCSSEGGTSPRSDTVAPGQVQDLVATRVTDDSVSLRWTAPGDDEFAGQASVYEIRYGTDALTEAEWEGGTPIERVPTPRAAGLEDRTGQGGLARGRWYFALRSADEELNWSSISNIATADLGDTIPPSAVTDLEVFGFEETNVTLTWTAPGDDGADGLATAYDLRRDQKPITEVGWEEAIRVDPPPVPIEAGSSERFTVIGLSEGQRYFFALRAEDDSGNLAALSNLVVATTSRDTIPPATITDLEVTFEGGRNVNLRWTAPGNNGQQGQAARYDLRLDDDPITSDSWEQASPVAGLPPPGITGADESFTVTGLDLDRGYHFAIRTEDEFGNRSDVSNDVAAMTMSLVILTQSSGPRLVDSPDWEPNGSRIVFSGYVGDQRQLLWVHSTGGNAVQITYRPDGVYSPRWSTDGQRLVCIAQRNQFPTVFDEVAVLEAREGAVPVAISPIGRTGLRQSPVWSPDGSQVAYVWGEFSVPLLGKILLLDSSGGEPDTLVAEASHISGLSWAPDGGTIVFASDRDGNYDLWSVPLSGGGPTLLLSTPSFEVRPAHSRDGSEIAYVSDAGGSWDVWAIAATGGEPRQLTQLPDDELSPSWSPSGDAIAFVLTRGGVSDLAIQYLR